ncbi:putative thiazole-containing bacteriocin maturation protein [Brevibacillus laterosporus]|uniref:putative thiazole-containing bacteriocin maturation protein n=1 Tax=Brevibacillus laterosporus TaxID=1465 RepID=UPI001EF27B4E|nr:putative thiazole-containing bacteriocin maturation protein [Brevibacillus laterosporus]MCG7317463.1 putative thiazole-containing bacteriocin maturation protein [Brevibacillus laterosporus]
MTKLDSSMRLKVKRDTFFLPDQKGNVYFRNNVGSFRMEGNGIDQWIEKLLPVFNGETTLGELTDRLPKEYQDRVFEIAENLFRNGFVQDVSQDRPHQLTDKILKKYASQIEFLSNLADSGAYRFMSYRQAKVLAIGSGPIFVSLVTALLDSGLSRFHMLVNRSLPTDRQRIVELASHARKADSEVAIKELALQVEGVNTWREAVQPFDAILYVSQEGDVEELRVLQAVCREEGKVLLPAICLQQVGVAGPLVHPDSEECWESAWRRIHQSALCKDERLHAFSSTAGAMLANVIVFELFKTITAVNESEPKNKVYLLDLETLEGNWHSFMSHPLVTGKTKVKWIEDLDEHLEQKKDSSDSNGLIPYFSTLTSAESGIFHIWEEGGLKQLPLAQCRIQATDPLSEGPAELLPEMVCTGMTHEEARKDAGLTGIEAYVSRMVPTFLMGQMLEPHDFVGVGAGETAAEGVSRGLQKCLFQELSTQHMDQKPPVNQVQLSTVEDEYCRFYLQALITMLGTPRIGVGAEVFGFPAVWVGTGERWYGSVGLNVTMALRNSLQYALLVAQNQAEFRMPLALSRASVLLEEQEQNSLAIPGLDETAQTEILQSALQVLKRNQKRLFLLDLAQESFLKKELAGVYGVLLREEESR